MKNIYRFSFVIVACLFLSACFGRIQPLYTVYKHKIPESAHILYESEISDVIHRAGIERQWIMEEAKAGVIIATQKRQTHVAVIEITYTQTDYSIRYVESSDLLYNGSTIHRTYNHWVRNLEVDIEKGLQMAALQAK
jgi:hypothetical protein